MIKVLKACLAPAVASFGVIAYMKGRYEKAERYFNRAIKWNEEIKEHEGGYYDVYRLLSKYRASPDTDVDKMLKTALNKLKAYTSRDQELNKTIVELQGHVDFVLGTQDKT
jgi:tetratricopeptide (TPR) repeat protein